MGGPGSGRKPLVDRKQVVENTLTIDLRTLLDQGLFDCKNSHGSIKWQSGSSVTYHLESHKSDSYLLNLEYRRLVNGTQHNLCYPILIEPLKNRYVVTGHIFKCPLIIDGIRCTRRVSKLYLTNDTLYFGCRNCKNLTYRVCQEYHNDDDGGLKQEAEMQRMEMTGHLNQSNEIVILNRN